ncbi:adenylate/guanylate cyclase domain-containing protein [Roseicyclus sp.]|uniref:adenylate/guanylate cyclase domain-containing protein n=1 Tax=Roseicyclus sp. TaxID=1914329 RepID=UPI001BCF5E37|nr:adenylate/guanylate cyclase domain-containing protein [Roseicyclus sp.]
MVVLIPALVLLSIADYRKANKTLQDNFDFMVEQTAQNVTGAYSLVEVGYEILSLSMENKMLAAFEPFKSAYFTAGGVVADIDLATLKASLGEEFDLYIIDENGVIIHTTFDKDLGLDFSKVAPKFNEMLQAIRLAGTYQSDRIASETVTGNVRKYAYWGTPDRKYILEIGIKSTQFAIPLSSLDLVQIATGFENFNPSLKSVRIFNGGAVIMNNPDFVPDDALIERVRKVYDSGVTETYADEAASIMTVYVKADVEERLDSVSQGDRVIELVFDTSEVNAQLASLAQNQILITSIFILLGGALSLVLAGTISRPIMLLNQSVKKIALGDLDGDIPKLSSSSEVSTLQNGIQVMKDNIQSRIADIHQLNQSFERFVPKEFLTLLEKDRITDVKLGDSRALQMSVLFSDMRNFTAISEKMSPEENFQFLNEYFSKLTPAIRANGGFIDKYIGDAIMALFPETPSNAVRASTEMIKSLKEWNKSIKRPTSAQLDMGIGIHVGDLILGTIGEADRMETTVISDTVNVSARLESLCKQYGANIIVSSAVFEKLDSEQKGLSRLIDQTVVKGKTEALNIYEVFTADDPERITRKVAYAAKINELVTLYYANKAADAQKVLKELSGHASHDRVVAEWLKRFG